MNTLRINGALGTRQGWLGLGDQGGFPRGEIITEGTGADCVEMIYHSSLNMAVNPRAGAIACLMGEILYLDG